MSKSAKLIFHPAFKARGKVTEMINNAILHYRDDIDLQNLIDFGQMEVKIKPKCKMSTCYRPSSLFICNSSVIALCSYHKRLNVPSLTAAVV